MKIGVVIVTYNRLEKLKTALEMFEAQTSSPQYILIVDNASTDGTAAFLRQWEEKESAYQKYVISQRENTGGSGGFFAGLEAAGKLDAQWIWVSDDDAFPEKDALSQAVLFLESGAENPDDLAAICGQVINKGKIDLMHRKDMYRKGLNVVEAYIPEAEYEKRCFPLNCFSYVGTILNKEKLAQVGLTNRDYFLWWDDTEHSLRMSKAGKILCVPAIKIHHDVENGTGGLTWKTYYGFRNMADLYRRHFPRICYEYFTLKLMCKTYLRDVFHKQKEENKTIRCALQDCRNGKFGIHEVYKPGWRPRE